MAESFTALVAFGDSLSDTGNAGRFSNGPVWVEHLAKSLGLPLRPSRAGGTNHAVGGARAVGGPNELRAQVRGYLAERGGSADPRALYTVWAGGNDLLAAGFASGPDTAGRAAAAAVGEAVAALGAAGARTVLVPNLPDIGITPALQAVGPAAAAQARRRSLAYDDALAQVLDRVAAATPASRSSASTSRHSPSACSPTRVRPGSATSSTPARAGPPARAPCSGTRSTPRPTPTPASQRRLRP
jgi:outer membrane lipase/esterase